MADKSSETSWPDYLPLPHEDIFAIGVVALNYCQLENIFRSVFSGVTRLNEHQTAALFHRLANNVRKDVLSELLAKTTIPEDLRELVRHFLSGFQRCADNRHFIMHSSSGGVHISQSTGRYGLVLQRFSRAGAKLECFLTLDELKVVADEIHSFSGFGAWVVGDITSYATHALRGHPEDFRGISPSTLRDKPALPTPLSWRSPDDPKAQKLPHAASTLLSPHRRRDGD